MTPCECLESWDELRPRVQAGLRALSKRHRALVLEGERFVCSVDLDAARKGAEPRAARWDYVVAGMAGAEGIEVHPAKASEVDVLIAKKQWAAGLLAERCGLEVAKWHWVRPPGSPLQFTPQSPQARRLAKHRISFPVARVGR